MKTTFELQKIEKGRLEAPVGRNLRAENEKMIRELNSLFGQILTSCLGVMRFFEIRIESDSALEYSGKGASFYDKRDTNNSIPFDANKIL